MAKKKTGVAEEIATQPEEVKNEVTIDDFTDNELQQANILGDEIPERGAEEAEDIEIPLDDAHLPEEEPEEETYKPEPVKDKTEDWTPDQLKKAYQNLEKVVGRQGQELGELRKKTTMPSNEPQTPDEKMDAMSDSELQSVAATFEADILKPNAAIEDDDYGQKVVLYQKAKEKLLFRRVENVQQSKNAQANNKATIGNFSETWKGALGDEGLQEVVKFAKERLSDQYGNISGEDLEVAMHKLYPAQYKTALSMAAAEGEKQRIVKAEANRQPRLSGAGSSAVTSHTISINKLAAMDEYDLQDYLNGLPYQTVIKIEEALKKHRK